MTNPYTARSTVSPTLAPGVSEFVTFTRRNIGGQLIVGRLLAGLESRGRLQTSDIFVTTDHGFSALTGAVRVAALGLLLFVGLLDLNYGLGTRVEDGL